MTPLPPYDTTAIEVPGGRVVIVVDPIDGAVVASGFADLDTVFGFLTEPEQTRGRRDADPREDSVSHVVDALEAYALGKLNALDHVVVRQPGGPFVQRAWLEMRGVHAGETDTYAGLAERAGSPRAIRAAGQACAKNKVAPFVPCHRILRTGGGLGGYAYGIPVKEALLVHEGALLV